MRSWVAKPGGGIARRRPGLALATLLLAAGCGLTYTSPSVKAEADGMPVSVVALTPAAVSQANASPYSPRSVPAAFYAVAGSAGGGVIGAGALPAEPYLPSPRREAQNLRALPDVTPPPYRIGVGDVLLLATRDAGSTVEQLSGLLAAQNRRQGYTVRDDGSIALPEVGPVQLAGLTVQEAEDRLFQALARNQIDPTFSLEVAEFNAQKVAVGGAVKEARVLPITPVTLTLAEALVAAGGLATPDEEFATIRIYREGTLYQIPVRDFLARSDLQSKALLNGDAVFVDTTYDLDRALDFYRARIDVIALRSGARAQALEALATEIGLRRAALTEQREAFRARTELDAEARDYVYLSGEVSSQSRVPLPYGRQATLADVLYDGGGFDTTTGDPSEIYVLRSLGGAPAVTAYHLDARNAVNLVLATRFEMRPNDIVFVEEQPITKWNRALQQAFPTLLNTAAARAAQ